MSVDDRPVIGICAVHERARWAFWDQDAHLVADSYVAPVQRAGGVAVVLPVDPRAPLELLDRIDGLMLIGGADLDPGSYGAARDPATESVYPDRDRFELAMVRAAIDRDLPLLAICRGMQILNVAFGGTLEQNLVAPDGSSPHRKIVGTFDGNDHTVRLVPGSVAAGAVGEELHLAHCHHHQAIRDLGDGLVVTGRADDGVVEALEVADGRWALGVQWHPEANDRTRLFAALIEAARSRARV
ncbi:MAG TPA: gamma-glutamyl-gamma-aminobutyrate hydrolase family protein [Solirubrobacteraceae bacterium]|nr:gamma-glutamyl-gamma-aminobutyrate hydrolase family protein [Solirubrobacteraceae bacterium]